MKGEQSATTTFPGFLRLDLLAWACALAAAAAPACLAASHVGNVADAAHDRGVARALGLDAQAWRSLDVAVGSLFWALPLGTRAARAAFGSALVVGAAGVVLFALSRALLDACARTARLGLFVAVIAAVTPLLSAPWQIEGAAVGGSVTGALLILLPVAVRGLGGSWAGAGFALGLALAYEPLVGACAATGCAALLVADARSREEFTPYSFAGGAAPALLLLALAISRTHAAGVPLGPALLEEWAGERGLSHAGAPAAFVGREWGTVLTGLVVAGAALAALVPPARPLASALVAVTLAGLACAWLGAPTGPTRYGAPVLAAFAAASALAGVAMQAAVRAVAAARLPLARASASMIVVLEAALPAEMADDAMVRAEPRAAGVAAAWDDAAWGALAPKSVLLVASPRVYARAVAARSQALLRDDVTVVPTFAHDPRAWRAMSADAALLPLWRELELVGAPSEAAVSSVASARPLAMAYEPRWDKAGHAIGKHLVPLTLFDEVEPEPRGASDRRRALDALGPARDRLVRAVHGDAELEAAARALLQARADLAASLPGEADVAARTAADASALAAAPGEGPLARLAGQPARPSEARDRAAVEGD